MWSFIYALFLVSGNFNNLMNILNVERHLGYKYYTIIKERRSLIMKRVALLTLSCLLVFGSVSVAYASSLDDIIAQSTDSTDNSSVSQESAEPVQEQTPAVTNSQSTVQSNSDYAEQYMNDLKNATKLDTPSAAATKVNQGIKTFASFVVQVIAYAVTALLVVRVLIDLMYICIPFLRSKLANGYQGNAQAGGGAQGGNSGFGGGGFGGGGFGNSGFGGGYGGGFGGGGFGNSSFGGGGFGGGMNQGNQASPATGRVQWVSEAALNAVAAGAVVDQNNKPISPLKAYAKDMVPTLVITPILLVLAITGVLTDLGFLIGNVIANAVSGISTML
jgi:hypothetical protein